MIKQLRYFLFVCPLLFLPGKRIYAQTSYTWNGSASMNWNVASNWTPNGIPGAPDNVTIVTGSNNCVLAANTSVNNITMTSGTLNVGAYTLSASGNAAFTAGTINGSGAINCSGTNTSFGNSSGGPTVAPAVMVNSVSITMTRSTFNNAVNLTKVASSSVVDSWRGGNTFNGYFKLINAAADSTGDNGDIWMGTNTTDPTDTYNARADFYVTGCARIRVPFNGKDVFNGVARFYSQGHGVQHDRIQISRFNGGTATFNDSVYLYCTSATTDVQVAYEAGTTVTFNGPLVATHYGPSAAEFSLGTDGNVTFNNNVILNNNGTGRISFTNGTGTSALASGKTVSVGALGFNSGSLAIENFTQLGSSTPQTLLLANTAALIIGTTGRPCVYNSAVSFTAPSIAVVNNTFKSTGTFTKTGGSNDSWGQNTFMQAVSISHSGSGDLYTSANTAAENFLSTVDLSITGTGNIRMARAFATVFPENITVSCTNTGYITFGDNGFSSTLAAGKTISVGAGGFTNGSLLLYLFNQTGTTPQSILMSGPLPKLRMGLQTASTRGCTFGGDLTAQAGFLELCGNTFNGATTLTQTGASGTARTWGSNTFTGAHTLTVNGSCTIQCSQLFSADVYGTTVSLNLGSGATGGIAMARTFNTAFNDNITVSSTGTGAISFGSNSGTSTLITGKTVTVGSGGFSSGSLQLMYFTQQGATPQSILATGSSILQYGPASTFNGNVVSTSGGLLFNGCTYNGTATCTKTGSSNDASTGNNFFNDVTQITNNGSGILTLGNGNHDEFNAVATFNNTGSSHLNVAYNSAGNIFAALTTFNDLPSATGSYITIAYGTPNNCTFNDNVLVNCVNGNGIYFGYNAAASPTGGTGTTTLAAGKTISAGASGFNSGTLRLRNFTQNGGTPQNITLTNTAVLEYGPASTFNGNVTSASPGLLLQGCTFNGIADCTKNGSGNDASTGNNIFNAAAIVTVTGAGYERLAGTTADDFNGNATFIQTGSGALLPAYNTNCTFAGNLIINAPAAASMTFASAAGGRVTMDGSIAQQISRSSGSNPPLINRFTLNKTAGDVTLNTRVNVGVDFAPVWGLLNTTATNILNLNNSAASTIGTADSYVNGPMNYDMALNGSRTLNLPIGKVADWRPAIVALTHSSGTSYTYTAEVFNASAQALGWSLPPTVDTVSYIHYWDINRSTTSSGAAAPSTGLTGNQTITLYFGTNDFVKDGANLTICKNTTAAPTSWIDIGGSGAPAYAGGANLAGNVSSTSTPSTFTSFSRFTLGSRLSGWNPLPIELLSFNATPQQSGVALKWVTATETDNDHFEIERSADASHFEMLKSVAAYGSGNSTHEQSYTTMDPQPLQGRSYYRLKQVDKNGSFTYSTIVSVDFSGTALFSMYPNPASDQLNFTLSGDSDAMIKIIDATGRTVRAYASIKALNGTVPLDGLSNGLYHVISIVNGTVKEQALIVQK